MIRALVYTDLQATEGAEKLHANPAIPLQRYRVRLFYNELLRIYKEYQCNAVWDLGDTTDDRTAVPIPTIQAIIDGIHQIPAGPGHLNLKIVGNHEQYHRDPELHSGGLFCHRFQVFDHVGMVDAEQVQIILAPHYDDSNQLVEEIDNCLRLEPRRPKIILGHFSVVGCAMNSGVASTGVPAELLKRAHLCLLGHIHLPQTMHQTIHYVGSPFQQDLGEAGEEKRVALVEIDGASIKTTFIPLQGFPQYHQVTLAQFQKIADQIGEDRYAVTVASEQEAEALYCHPQAGKVRIKPVEAKTGASEQKSLTKTNWSNVEAACAQYAAVVPPGDLLAQQVTAEDLVSFGVGLVQD